jgi:hypothetical protein
MPPARSRGPAADRYPEHGFRSCRGLKSEQNGKPEIVSLSFDERFGMLVDAEWTHPSWSALAAHAQENKRLATGLREAKLKLSSACGGGGRLDRAGPTRGRGDSVQLRGG